jgi:hypothetical protein
LGKPPRPSIGTEWEEGDGGERRRQSQHYEENGFSTVPAPAVCAGALTTRRNWTVKCHVGHRGGTESHLVGTVGNSVKTDPGQQAKDI